MAIGVGATEPSSRREALHEAVLAVLEAQSDLCLLTARSRADPMHEASIRFELQARILGHLKLMAPHASQSRLEVASEQLSWTLVELRFGVMDRFFLILERAGCAQCCGGRKWS